MLISGLATAATPRLRDQRDQLRHVVIVHRVHRRQVRAGDASVRGRAAAPGTPASRCAATAGSSVSSQCMSTRSPRSRRELAEDAHRLRAVVPSCARNAGCRRRRPRRGRARASRLSSAALASATAPSCGNATSCRSRYGATRSRTSSSASTASKARVADVDVRADREQTPAHRPVAIGERPVDQRVDGQQRLELAPQRDAFQQRARRVDARQPVRQRRVHVEVRVDERRRHELALRVELGRAARGGELHLRRDGGDPPVAHGDVHRRASVGQRRVADDEVVLHRIRNGGRRVHRSPLR